MLANLHTGQALHGTALQESTGQGDVEMGLCGMQACCDTVLKDKISLVCKKLAIPTTK